MTPEQFRTDEVVAFVVRYIGERARVLEVGCGRGAVAAALATRGFEVVALDVKLRDLVEAPGVAFVERDFLDYEDAPFDAVVFTSSLHHISPLDRAIETAVRLLKVGGRLVADDFDLEAPDDAALRWYYDTQELLVVAGLYQHEHLDHPHADLPARWRHAHEHHDHPPLHTGAAMRAAIAARMTIERIEQPPYLYRYIGSGLPSDDRGGAIAAHLHDVEKRYAPVGLRIIARRS